MGMVPPLFRNGHISGRYIELNYPEIEQWLYLSKNGERISHKTQHFESCYLVAAKIGYWRDPLTFGPKGDIELIIFVEVEFLILCAQETAKKEYF